MNPAFRHGFEADASRPSCTRMWGYWVLKKLVGQGFAASSRLREAEL